MLLARLRWSAFGLRGRIVGAVLATTAISLGVAALVLLPRLEGSLKNASKKTLSNEIAAATSNLNSIAKLHYWLIPEVRTAPPTSQLYRQAATVQKAFRTEIARIGDALGAPGGVTLMGYLDAQGNGTPIAPAPGAVPALGPVDDVVTAYEHGRQHLSFGTLAGGPVVRAAIPLSQFNKDADAVLVVRKSIDEIAGAVDAVRRALLIAAAVAIVLTLLLAIPLAGTLVSRLQRLRQAALQLAIGGNVGSFPADRARDEVGDLSRSFAIMQRRLRQQEEARRAFVATASHELRTPLASLEGMLELLADDLEGQQPDLEDAAALLDRARVQSRRLARLAADLLDLSR
ncbi:MAG: HAMP domain-containing protein, partial [Acidobacteriota bacterium]|nr:HAMP domain-containing protein [Acidobacteriota bacterium]